MAAKGNKRGKKGANGYKLPDPIPQGEILTDLSKKQWTIGKSIGVGGFGELYSASPYPAKSAKDYVYVVKIEPHGNGPLFVEMHFYMRNAKPEDIEVWKKKKKLPHLGMPQFISSGSHECKGTKYRFVVMERYGRDLWNIFLENNRLFPENTVYKLAIQIIDVLEYIHAKMYVHADIKGANLLMDRNALNKVFLVDFGLASKVTQKTEYKVDPKKAHNGTIEYTSRDAHMGIPTMRGDMEILGYNIVQWLAGQLPWEKNLKDPGSVQKAKIDAFSNIDKFLKDCFRQVPTTVSQFMHIVGELKFTDTPNYEKMRMIFEKALQKSGQRIDSNLIFTSGSTSTSSIKSSSVATSSSLTNPDPPKSNVKRVKKLDSNDAVRRSPRTRPKNPSPKRPFSLDESTVGIVMDKKREKLKAVKKMLETIDDDSETEYDVKITKKKKRADDKGIQQVITPVLVSNNKTTVRRGKKKIVEPNSDSENEVRSSRKVKSRKVPEKKRQVQQHPAFDSDEDIFA